MNHWMLKMADQAQNAADPGHTHVLAWLSWLTKSVRHNSPVDQDLPTAEPPNPQRAREPCRAAPGQARSHTVRQGPGRAGHSAHHGPYPPGQGPHRACLGHLSGPPGLQAPAPEHERGVTPEVKIQLHAKPRRQPLLPDAGRKRVASRQARPKDPFSVSASRCR